MIRPALIAALAASSALAHASEGADARLAGYRTPPGWKVEIAATEPLVVNPVTMTFGDDGRLFVVEWQAGRGPNDRIKVLTDRDGDGTFDESAIYMDNLELPAGVLFWDGWTYVTLDHDVVRFQDKDGDGRFEERQAIVTGFGNDDSHHRVSGMTLGPDGWLYLTTGDSDARAKGSDGSEATVLRSGGVFRCKPDGSRLEVVAMGMRNPWGNVAFDDEFRIFHADNDNEGSPGFTGCRLLHVVEGGDYGWRLREGARCCQPDFDRATWNGGRPGRLGWIAETGRGAPAGLCVLNSAAFPPSTRNLVVYPDVFRKLVRAYQLKPAGATFAVDREFELLAADDPLFRPDDAEVGPDGALYVLDWRTDSGGAGQLSGNGKTGRIYRMSWSGTDAEPARPTLPRDRFAGLTRVDEAALVDALRSDDHGLRRKAHLELIRRKPGPPPALKTLAADPSAPTAARLHAMAALSAISPEEAAPAWRAALEKPDDPSARWAAELAGRFSPRIAGATAGSLLLLTNPDPQVRRASALALGNFDWNRGGPDSPRIFNPLGRLPAEVVANRLLNLISEPEAIGDPFLRDGIARGVDQLGEIGLNAVRKAIMSGSPRYTEAALFTLQASRGPEGLALIVSTATANYSVPAAARANLFRALRELGPAVPPEPIADWLAKGPKVEPAARAEAIRVLASMGGRAVLGGTSVVAPLLKDEDAEVRRAALVLASKIGDSDSKAALVDIAGRPDRTAEERRLALVALRIFHNKDLAPTFAGALGSSTDPALRGEALRGLAELDFPRAAGAANDLLSDPSREVRAEAIAVLGQKPETALAVVTRYNEGKLPREDLSRVIEAIRPHKTPELSAALAALMKARMLGSSGAGEVRQFGAYVRRYGNATRGKAVYLDAGKANCASCHRMEGSGGAVGPDLTRVWETLSFDKKVESILDPSREIKEGYGTFKVATRDGRTVAGLLLADTAEGVTLKDAQGREVRIPAAEVEEKGVDKVSLMPDGVVGHLSLAEFADLLAFLGDRQAQESLKADPPTKP